ncbi:hypothetical protein IQ276_003615 [Desmonostoc muscorum LEGE 12446]|uniref:Uncharacterized protein n=1 Tax=Desmonostoc muscorum LEGE 12446 TaxID=1828758 RepID=A0A8J7A1D7_DESMC|nr:hypothetical protein [Desmonostoc muscorum]MCF2145555.1 hypothetical protein [Desmonostoc muscorum LEGE 12446]
MSEQIIKSELLTELSTEEQQLLAGGYYGGDDYYTAYDEYGNAYTCYPYYNY